MLPFARLLEDDPTSAFGVPALDRGLGAIAAGGSVVLRHEPEVEALPFLLQAAAHHTGIGHDVIFVLTGRKPSRLLHAMETLAGPCDPGHLYVVDAHSALVGEREPCAYPVAHPVEPSAIVKTLERATSEHPGAVILLESFSALIDRGSPEEYIRLLPRILACARRSAFLAGLFTSWSYEEDLLKTLERFDAMAHLRGVEERVVLHQSLAVERTPWTAQPHPILYKINRPGGVLAYIPKILVLGPHHAGKSTFVHNVCTQSTSVDRLGTTVAIDRGIATLDGVQAEVFGTPGQERFDPLLYPLARQAVAVVLMIDATKPATFARAQEMLRKVWRQGQVVTIVLNKSEQGDALTAIEARRRLAPPPGVDVVPCTATDPASARAVLNTVVNRVLSGVPG